MKSLVALATVLFLGSMPAAAAEITGYISDNVCVSKNTDKTKAMDWIQPAAFEACAKKCVKEGSEVVFVTEDNKILRMDAASVAKAMPHLGQRVSVQATIKDGAVTLSSISTIKMGPHTGGHASADDHDHSR
jgi:hypothetical protein